MAITIVKILLSASIITFVSWLSGIKSQLAGFLTALPLTTLIALAFSQYEWKNSTQTVSYAKSIFFAIPITLLFFLPFLLSEKLNLSFWQCYFSGFILLILGYPLHKWVVSSLFL